MADIQKYIDLITSQHKDKPKFIAWLTAHLDIADDAKSLLDALDNYFDIDSAVGTQLDILGEKIGRARVLTFQPTDGSSPVLEDEMYRLILKAKIAQNQWDGTINQIYDLWYSIFDQVYLVLKDNQNMTLDVLILGLSTDLEKDLVANGYIIPKPQGVKINYAYSATEIFAYGMDNDNFKGYGEGYWLQYL